MKRKRSIFHYGFLLLILTLCFVFPITVSADTKQVPGKVELTKVSAPSYNRIRIQWEKTTDATHYRIYYRKTGEKKWTFVRTVSKDVTQYTHLSNKKRPIIVGQKYEYTVRAYNKIDNTYGEYDKSGLCVKTKPDMVKLKSAKVANGGIAINWNKALGCDHYRIYRKDNANSRYKCIATISASNTSYTDKKPLVGNNIYTVRGYHKPTKTYGNYDKKGLFVKFTANNSDNKPNGNHNNDFTQKELDKKAKEVLRLTNIARKEAGLHPLKYNQQLQDGAMHRAKELKELFSHMRPNGTMCDTIAGEFGIKDFLGENLAKGIGMTPQRAINIWLKSPLHHFNMMRPENEYVGIGCAKLEGRYVGYVQLFGGSETESNNSIMEVLE